MTYQLELLVEERLADLRRTAATDRGRSSRRMTWRPSLKVRLGQVLLRLGERLAQPAGTPAVR
jgi:hypothetical protein